MIMIKCKACKQLKSEAQFRAGYARAHYLRCKICEAAYKRGYRDRQIKPEKVNRAVGRTPTPRWTLHNLVNRMKDRSKLKDLTCEITVSDLMALYEKNNGCCSLTGIEFTWYRKEINQVYDGKQKWNSMSVDRIDSSKGYTIDNVQLILNCINMFKGQMTIDQTMMIAKAFVEKSGHKYATIS